MSELVAYWRRVAELSRENARAFREMGDRAAADCADATASTFERCALELEKLQTKETPKDE